MPNTISRRIRGHLQIAYFCSTNILKHIQFTMIQKQESSLTYEKVEPANVLPFSFINDLINRFSKQLSNFLLVDEAINQLIVAAQIELCVSQ